MPNSTNTLWLVSCTISHSEQNGSIHIDHCNARAYRLEKNARARYKAVVESLIEQGYIISDLDVPRNEEYEGVYAHKPRGSEYYNKPSNAVVFIDRNPVWTPG